MTWLRKGFPCLPTHSTWRTNIQNVWFRPLICWLYLFDSREINYLTSELHIKFNYELNLKNRYRAQRSFSRAKFNVEIICEFFHTIFWKTTGILHNLWALPKSHCKYIQLNKGHLYSTNNSIRNTVRYISFHKIAIFIHCPKKEWRKIKPAE